MHAVWDGATHAFILDTMVDPGFQRLGIGRDLVAAITDEAFTAGCDWVHVDYEPEYATFYEHACGFRPTPAGLSAPADASPSRQPAESTQPAQPPKQQEAISRLDNSNKARVPCAADGV